MNLVQPSTTCVPDTRFRSTYLIKLVLKMLKKADQVLKKQCDLTHSQCQVLGLLKTNQVLSQEEIASRLELTPAAVSRLTETLAEKKFLARHENPDNRRQNQLKVTPLGEKQLSQALHVLEQLEQSLYRHIPAQHLDVFLTTAAQLEKLIPD